MRALVSLRGSDFSFPASFPYEHLSHLCFRDKTNADAERAMFENDAVANTDPADMKLVRLNDQQTGQFLEIPVVEGLFAAMGSGTPSEDGLVLEDDPAFKYDDHMTHCEIHRKFILSSEFKYLHPELQAAIMVHADYHKWVLEDQQRQAQASAVQQVAELEAMKAAAAVSGEAPEGEPGNGGMPAEGMPPTNPDEYQPNVFRPEGSWKCLCRRFIIFLGLIAGQESE